MNKKRLARIFYFLPRIITIVLILFLALFALDIFDSDYTPLEILIGLSMHLIPNAILAVILAIAWKFEIIGGILFIILSFLTLMVIRGEGFGIVLYVILFIIGLLFLVSSYMRRNDKKIRK